MDLHLASTTESGVVLHIPRPSAPITLCNISLLLELTCDHHGFIVGLAYGHTRYTRNGPPAQFIQCTLIC